MDIINKKEKFMKKKIVSTLLLIGLFTACSQKNLAKQESAFIVIKTPAMKYADMGFISHTSSLVKVDIYAAGQPLMNFEINGMNVCMSTFECMDKASFNEKVLSKYYDDEVLEDIFRAEPIFNGENLEKEADGFTQKIKKENKYNITYSVISNKRTFRDTINNILIKVREQ